MESLNVIVGKAGSKGYQKPINIQLKSASGTNDIVATDFNPLLMIHVDF